MRTLLQIIVLFIFLLTGCSSPREASISFRDQSAWIKQSAEWYEISGPAATGTLTLLQHWPDRRGEAANSMVRWENLPEQFTGGHCYGRFYLDSADTNSVVAIFMMSVDDKLWSGRFRGSAEGWNQALTFLKSAEKNR
jgi:hypothetical protein